MTESTRMTGKDKPVAPPADGGKPTRPRAPATDDDDREDGDIATPKQDRYGNDDEPLE
jgi:hypothetical protein